MCSNLMVHVGARADYTFYPLSEISSEQIGSFKKNPKERSAA